MDRAKGKIDSWIEQDKPLIILLSVWTSMPDAWIEQTKISVLFHIGDGLNLGVYRFIGYTSVIGHNIYPGGLIARKSRAAK